LSSMMTTDGTLKQQASSFLVFGGRISRCLNDGT
jgi:hypothetical protein